MGKLVRNDYSYHFGSIEDHCVNYYALAPTSWKVKDTDHTSCCEFGEDMIGVPDPAM